MNNDISLRPAYLGETAIPGAFSDAMGQPARITMDAGFETIDENGQAVLPPSLELDVILLRDNDTRIYYPKNERGESTYDPSTPVPPTCYSDNRVTPSVGAMQPQSDLCATCPRSVWDQPTPKGNLVPACQNRYKIACLVKGAGDKVFLLGAAPTSRKPYEAYKRFLKAHHAEPHDVITRLRWIDKALTFEFVEWVNEKVVGFIADVQSTDEPAMIVNALDKPRERHAALPAPEPVRQVAAVTHPPVQQATPAAEWGQKAVEQAILPPTEALKRGRGRPPREAAASAAGFTPQPSPPAPKGNGNGFGMETPQAPPPNIQDALEKAFGPR